MGELTLDRTGVANGLVGHVRVRGRTIVWCDSAFAQMFAYAAEELIDRPASVLCDGDKIRVDCGELESPVIAPGEILRRELQLRRKDGSPGRYDISMNWLSPESDEWCGAFIDVSEDRNTWLSLIEAEEHYRSLFVAMAEGVVLHARDGRVVDANGAAERILGLSRGQILGKTSMDPQWQAMHEDGTAFPGDEHPASVTLRTGRPLRDQLMGVRARGGSVRWISINTQPIFGEDGSVPSAAVATFVDVTEARSASQAIKKALWTKDAMLREIHHRVKNNMQVISSLLRLHRRHLQGAGAACIFLECENRIRSMALVHEQLSSSTSLTDIDFGKYLGNLSQLIAQSQRSGDARVKITIDCEPLRIGVETAIPLGLIANELMTNVFKHAFDKRKEGNLTLSLRSTGAGTLLLSVADNGIGLPTHFNFRETKSVGLSIVRNLARQLRASLSFREVAGGGSCVEVSSSYGA
jgi:PAS domain S-box-containing protein